jgi:hypothetical protein
MELSMNLVVKIAIVLIVLVVISAFITTQSGTQFTQSDANRIFNEKCLYYKSSYNCDYNQATADADFPKFFDSCRSLYGSERDSFTCLDVYCQSCSGNNMDKSKMPLGTKCTSFCQSATGLLKVGQSNTVFCSRFSSECGSSGVNCDVC